MYKKLMALFGIGAYLSAPSMPPLRGSGRLRRGSRTQGKTGVAGNKIRKRVRAETFGLINPGGIVSEHFREVAKERNLAKLKKQMGRLNERF